MPPDGGCVCGFRFFCGKMFFPDCISLDPCYCMRRAKNMPTNGVEMEVFLRTDFFEKDT